MKSWIKRGIFGVGFGFIISILVGLLINLFDFNNPSDPGFKLRLILPLFLLPGLLITLLIGGGPYYSIFPEYISIPLAILFSLIFWFILGIFIGWSYEKIKYRFFR